MKAHKNVQIIKQFTYLCKINKVVDTAELRKVNQPNHLIMWQEGRVCLKPLNVIQQTESICLLLIEKNNKIIKVRDFAVVNRLYN